MNVQWTFNVSDHLDKGGREYMEDFICNHIERINNKVVFGVFGIFDGHGGSEAAFYVKTALVRELKDNINFWSSNDTMVLKSIKEVFSRLQSLMWIERENWPKRIAGSKSTAGTTATIAIIRNDKLFIGHVGDSAMVMACQDGNNSLTSDRITKDHKPSDIDEKRRIEESGGTLERSSNVDRVVWFRMKASKEIEQIPFLAVARSLGDLWSYDCQSNCYHVSPEPDVTVLQLDPKKHRGFIIASDGVWNVVNENTSIAIINACDNIDRINNKYLGESNTNIAETLVKYTLFQWKKKNMRPDNISAVVVTLVPQYHIIENETVSDSLVDMIQSEILSNDLFATNYHSKKMETLEFIDSFQEYAPTTISTMPDDKHLLKIFILSSEKLAKHCFAWKDDTEYWQTLYNSFSNIGVTKLPNLISYFDNSSFSFEETVASFSWSLTCLKCIDETYLNPHVIAKLSQQPFLSEFWILFYKKIIHPDLSLTPEKLSTPSTYCIIMKKILLCRTSKIRRFIETNCDKDDMLEDVTHYNLKKSHSINSNVLPAVFPFVTLKRSYSFEGSNVVALVSSVSVMSSEFNSRSSTPILHGDDDSEHEMLDDANDILPKYVPTRKRSIISLTKKLSYPKNLSRLSIHHNKRRHSSNCERILRYVPKKKLKSD